jgi:hypothetical protein
MSKLRPSVPRCRLPDHKNLPFAMYCEAHAQALCSQCVITNHLHCGAILIQVCDLWLPHLGL